MTDEANRVLIADSHALCREGLSAIFKRCTDFSDIHQASEFPTALSRIAAQPPINLLIIDLGLTGLRKDTDLRDLRVKFPALRVVVVAETRDRDQVLEALGAGVHGYIPKDMPPDEMLKALRRVLAGQIYVPALVCELAARKERVVTPEIAGQDAALTTRQYEVLSLLAAGRSNKEIARLLCIAEGTVKVHIAAAFRMLGVHNRVSAAAAMQTWPMNDRLADDYLPGFLDRRARPGARRYT